MKAFTLLRNVSRYLIPAFITRLNVNSCSVDAQPVDTYSKEYEKRRILLQNRKLLNILTMIEQFTKVPIKQITTPHEGAYVTCDTWWVVTEDNHVLFFRGKYPQHNRDKQIIENYINREGFYPYKCHAEYLPVAYFRRSDHG